MKKQTKIAKTPPSKSIDFWVCETNGHDFYQVSEPSNYFPGSGLGQLTALPTNKQPRFICRKCGKVIQL